MRTTRVLGFSAGPAEVSARGRLFFGVSAGVVEMTGTDGRETGLDDLAVDEAAEREMSTREPGRYSIEALVDDEPRLQA